MELLRNRYGGSSQADKYRMELRLRRRAPGESLSTLHRDIRKLMALAHPDLPQQHRETIACDYYIDSLNDPAFALKVRERNPSSLDDALRVSLQLEAWGKDAARAGLTDDKRAFGKQARGTTVGNTDNSNTVRQLQHEVDQLIRKVEQLTAVSAKPEAAVWHDCRRDTQSDRPSEMFCASQDVPFSHAQPKGNSVNEPGRWSGTGYSRRPQQGKFGTSGDNANTGANPNSSGRQPKREVSGRMTFVCWHCGQPGHK